jgi:hypothetical protein
MRSSRSTKLAVALIGATASMGVMIGSMLSSEPVRTRRKPTHAERTLDRFERRGQSPEQAQVALDAAQAKRDRRIARNKRLAGEAV